MTTKVYETKIHCPVERAWQFFAGPDALKILTPADNQIQILSPNPGIREGYVMSWRVRQFGLWINWKTRLSSVRPPYEYIETGIKTPFKSWTHHHELIDEEGECLLRDTVAYEPKGFVGKLITHMVLADAVDEEFKHRHVTARRMLEDVKAVVNADLIEKQTVYVSDFELDSSGDLSKPT